MKIFVPAMGRVNTSNRDGSEVRFAEIAKVWLARGIQLLLLLPKREIGVLESQGVHAEYQVHWEPFSSESDSLWNVLKTYLWRIVTCPFVSYPKDVDAVYAPSDFLFDLLPAILCRLRNAKAKFVVCVFLIAPNPFVGYENMYTSKLKIPSVRALIYWVVQWMSLWLIRIFKGRMLVLNSLDKDALVARGVDASIVHVVTMGVDGELFQAVPEDRDAVGYDGIYLGRLHPQKGLFDLVKIWKRVNELRPGSRLGVIGGGGEWWFNTLKEEIAKAGLDGQVDLLGFRQGAEKIRLLKSAKCFVIPSHYESFGQVAVEAMACGLPVVAYDLPIFREVFPKGMRKVPLEDIEAFSAEVVALLDDPAKRAADAVESLAVAAGFDWKAIAAGELKLIERSGAGA